MHPRNKRKNRFESKRTVQSDGEWEGVRWGARGNETEQRNASICSRTLNRASYSSVRFVLQFLNEKLIESIQIRSRHAWKGFPRKLHTEHPHKELALVSFQVAWKGDVARRPFLSPFFFQSFYARFLFLFLFFLFCFNSSLHFSRSFLHQYFSLNYLFIKRHRLNILYKTSTKCRACQSAVCRALAVCKLSLMHVVLSVLACRDSVL